MSKEIICNCGKPLFYGEVTARFGVVCGSCSAVMTVEPEKPIPALAAAIVESFKGNPEVCYCAECRVRLN